MADISYQLEELIPIAARLAERYTGYEHSSITYEKAEMLMGAVMYCIDEYENGESDKMILEGKRCTADEAYMAGLKRIKEKAVRLQAIFNDMIPSFRDYGVECLRDTVVKGIPAFLLRYDVEYAPQETLLTLDYPLLSSIPEGSGVTAVLAYINGIRYEQKLLGAFSKAYVIDALKAYHRDYKVLIENVSEIVLQNIVEHMLLDRFRQSTEADAGCRSRYGSGYNTEAGTGSGFSAGEYAILEDILARQSRQQLEEFIKQVIRYLTDTLLDKDEAAYAYFLSAGSNIAVRMKNSMGHEAVKDIFEDPGTTAPRYQ